MINKDKEKEKLQAICILDGRNREKIGNVTSYFSEFALIKYRIYVEISYLIFLSEKTHLLRKLSEKEKDYLHQIWSNFSLDDALEIKEIEYKINHDVKAVEYFLKEKLARTSLKDISTYIHFGLTSYDVNIPAYALILQDFRKDILNTIIDKLLRELKKLIISTKNMGMLGRTHGQPALPTTMGKEIAVYYQRIQNEFRILKSLKIEAKLTGAVGNFNALEFVAPDVDWIKFSYQFIKSLGLEPNLITTQIIPYESWLRLFDSVKRLNNILVGFCKDIWWYISFDYFRQKKKDDEVGSSTMSHKINPITFENAEGNLGLANALFEFFGNKLSYSRLQRDLSDSTVKRDFGLAFGFTLLAYDSILNGLARISPNPPKMKQDLDNHWEIFAEGIQTYLRFKGLDNAYEILKEKTRGKTLTKLEIYQLIDELPLSDKDKKKLKIENLSQYKGLSTKLAEIVLSE